MDVGLLGLLPEFVHAAANSDLDVDTHESSLFKSTVALSRTDG
jgi:hypothetical protein